MEYADLLAATCVAAKQAADLTAARQDFETSASRERVLRDYIDRMQDLAKDRESAEPQGVSDYIGAGAGKMLSPIPGSWGEAALRGAGAGIGGAIGASMGENLTGSTPEVISGVVGKMPEGKKDLGRHLAKRLRERGIPSGRATQILKQLRKLDPESSAWELKGLRSTEVGEPLAKILNRSEGSRKIVRGELVNVAKQLGEKFELPRRWTLGGGIAGAVAGGALAGLPFAVKALYDKYRGGEGAVSARSKAQEALEEANALSRQREHLLKRIRA